MKSSSALFVVLSSVFVVGHFAHADEMEVDIALEDVHVPLGFDSNDKNVEIMVTGVKPDSCYQSPKGIVKIDGKDIVIDMKATKLVDNDRACIQSVEPYLATIDLGPLRAGHYDIKVNKGKNSEKDSELLVGRPSAPSTDNFAYANVTNVETHHDKGTLLLKGAHTSGCMSIDHVEVVPNQSGNTFAILPIVRQDKMICDRMMKPFAIEVPLPPMHSEAVVFHVRKSASRAINIRD